MDSQIYFHEVRRTAKAQHIDPSHEKFHWLLGMVGELHELHDAIYENKNKVIDEAGDVLWYMANFCHAYFLDFNEIVKRANLFGLEYPYMDNTKGIMVALYNDVSQLAELAKKRAFYTHKTIEDEQFISLLVDVGIELYAILEDYEVTLEQAMQANIDKLAVRYPDKFNG